MQRKTVFVTIVAVLALAATSCLSPWWTLHRMRAAIDARDYKAFSSYVDFPSLRASFKSQLVEAGSGKQERNESILGALGEGIAGALAGPMLDLVLDAPGVIEMINQGTPAITRAVISSALTKVPPAADAPADLEAAYRGWNSVVFRGTEAAAADGSFILVRRGLWSWKLAAVELSR